ncbi:MAG: signal peptidase I [Candidatus Nomurabacteria bacterium]|nr:signal peptidase I [Candidatus Nomurabacteria bacterium]
METQNEDLKGQKTQETIAQEKKQTFKENFWELVRFAFIAIVIVIPIRIFVAQPFVVSGTSMVPTFQNGQYLIVDELTYNFKSPQRGDVVVFRYPGDTSKFFIKRIIGLPGETVDVKAEQTIITNKEHPEGFALDQSYVKNHSEDSAHRVLTNDEYFVMGDNRSGSSDSRYWGPVPKKLLVGRALIRLLPITKISFLPGYYKQLN